MISLLLAASLATAPAEIPYAVTIFESVCMQGEARFGKEELLDVEVSDLPPKAKALLNANLPRVLEELYDLGPEFERALPSTAYGLVEHANTYLLVPDSSTASGFRSTCAVLVSSDVFLDGKRAIARFTDGTDGNVTKPKTNEVSFVRFLPGSIVTLSKNRCWTMLATISMSDRPKVEKDK